MKFPLTISPLTHFYRKYIDIIAIMKRPGDKCRYVMPFLILFLQISVLDNARATEKNTKPQRVISGTVAEGDAKHPINYALVELLRKSDNAAIGSGYTDNAGKFNITVNENAELLLRVSLLGYQKFSTAIPASTSDYAVPDIYLKIDAKQLNGVTITAKVPIIRQEVDRISYDVQADPESKISSLLDMLRKVPLITVDADDNVKLKSSSNYKVLIDGKESSIVARNPKDVFNSLSASNILRIEVITTPPAKYDSEGLAGIINVVTIKKITGGYSGNVGASYKFPNGPRANGAINLKAGKFGLSAFGGGAIYNTPRTSFTNSQTGLGNFNSNIEQAGTAKTNTSSEYISTQLSYEIDTLNLLTVNLGYNRNVSDKVGNVFNKQTIDTLFQSYRLTNRGNTNGHGYDLGLDYQLGFARSKSQFLTFSYKYTRNKNKQDNVINAFDRVNYDNSDYNQFNNSGLKEHTAQIDYSHPLTKLQIDGGVKAILRNNFSDYIVEDFDPLSGGYIKNNGNSNQFTYEQNVYSVYNSYQLNLKKWTVKAGVRVERTTVDADFVTQLSKLNTNYTNVIPSVAIQNKISKSSSLNFGYTERIQRPGIMQLNPFVDQQNPQFITYGNPGLKPELNHIISLNYGIYKKSTVNMGLSYSFSNNTIQYISIFGSDGVTRSTFQNLGKNKNLEADLNINIPVSQRVNLGINGQVNYLRLSGVVDSALYQRKAWLGSASVFANYKFDNDWRAGFNFLYFSPAITLQGTSVPYYYTGLSLSKTFNKNFTISGSLSNPYLKYLNYKNKVKDPRFNQVTTNDIVYRRFNLGVNYKFGKLKDGSIKKNKKGIQNDDIKVVPSSLPSN